MIRRQVEENALLGELRSRLGGSGEAEAIALAREHGLTVLLDERAGRRAAKEMGLLVKGSLWVLRVAKSEGRIDRVRPLVEQIVEAGTYYHDDLLLQFFRQMGEA